MQDLFHLLFVLKSMSNRALRKWCWWKLKDAPSLKSRLYVAKPPMFISFLGRWGGIWRAPREYTFVATDNKQTFVELVKKFDNWKYDDYGVEKRMPWISGPKLTTSWNATGDRQWGTLIGEEYAHTKFSYYFYFHPLHPNINRYILHTLLFTFPKVLKRRIC